MLKKLRLNELIKMMKYMKSRLMPYFAGLIGFAVTEASILVIIPFIMKYMIDAAVKGDISLLKRGVMIIGIEAIVLSILFIWFIYLFWSASSITTNEIRLKLFKHLERLPLSYFEKNHSGDIISRFTNDLGLMQNAYSWNLREILFVLVTGIGSAACMFILKWELALILLLVGALTAYININFSRSIRSVSDRIQKKMGSLTEKMADMFGGFTVMKIFHLEDYVMNLFNRINEELLSLNMERIQKSSKLESCNYFFSWINFGGIMAAGALLVVNGVTELGTVVALMRLLGGVNFMLRRLGGQYAQLQNSLSGAKRVMDFFDIQEEPRNFGLYTTVNNDAAIQIDNITFEYEDSREVIKGLSISVEQGQIAAIVGPSGGGKSTLIKILLGFYPPKSGSIAINGKSLGNYTLEQLRSIISYVPQDAYIFDGTIEENIRYGRPNATHSEVIEAAKSAHAHEFILGMTEGYNTKVGERGVRLSGGQRQRVAIARALLKDSPILLLDEATASLDSQTEQIVQDALDILMNGRTVLVIAHRLSTVQHADIIYVLHNGKVVEKGRHEELLNIQGIYKDLFELQFNTNSKVVC